MAAGTVAYTEARVNSPVKRLICTWTSDSSGDVNGTASHVVSGTIVRVTFNPSATAPTDNYDAVLNDEDGVDVLAGLGANRDTSTTENFCPAVSFTDGTTVGIAPMTVEGKLTLVITNAGDSKSGVVTVYMR